MQDWLVTLLRSIAFFILILVSIRLMGKRQPSRITPFNFVTYIVIALITSFMILNIIQDLTLGLIALGVWVLSPIALDYLSMKSKWIHDLVNGKETILIKQGKIMEENLLQVRLTGEDLLRDLRSKNVFNLTDVEFAVLEPTGDLNVLLKSDKKPVTASDLGEKVAPQSEPQTVILDGNILNEPLANLGLNRDWLKMQLEAAGVALDNVFIGQIDAFGDLYLDLFDDAIQIPQPKVKELLYANLQKSQADLVSFSLETKDKQAKTMYSRNADKLAKLTKKLKPYLLH